MKAAIIEATLALAAERGWRGISLADIAHRAEMPMADLYKVFPSKTAILESYFRRIDEQMLHDDGDVPDVVLRDRLFDVVMRRFEAMAPHKQALSRIMRDSVDDPMIVLCGSRRVMRSLGLMLETAGISTTGFSGLLKIEGMAAVYAYAMRAWFADETDDFSHTMAALDKALRRAEGLAGLVWRRLPPSSTPNSPQTSPPSGSAEAA